jgi:hypothetical protein
MAARRYLVVLLAGEPFVSDLRQVVHPWPEAARKSEGITVMGYALWKDDDGVNHPSDNAAVIRYNPRHVVALVSVDD